MTQTPSGARPAPSHPDGREAEMAALFAAHVMQQTSIGMMLLGRVPHPETGQVTRDLDGARLFISQLEMLAFKTRGNLDKREENLLKQSLMELQLAFVEATEKPLPAETTDTPAPTEKTEEPAAHPQPAEDASKVKFSKKY